MRIAALLIATLLVPVQAARTQDPKDRKLEERVTALEKDVDALLIKVKALQAKMGAAAIGRTANQREIERMRGQLADLRGRMANQEAEIIALSRDVEGAVEGAMERRSAFRGDPPPVTTSRITFINNTGVNQYTCVNGSLWRVIPGRSYLLVPRAPVSVHPPGGVRQVLNNWRYDARRGYELVFRF